MKILSGAEHPSAGTIRIGGTTQDRLSPSAAIEQGIGIVYQEHNLVQTLSVMENIFLGKWPGNRLTVDHKKMKEQSKALLQKFEINVDPLTPVEFLSPAMQQVVEIVKTISVPLKVLILDEPSAPLTLSEVDILFSIIRKMKENGTTVIYISHRLEEIFSISDRVSVLKDGVYIDTLETGSTSRSELIGLMVGRDVTEEYPQRETKISDENVISVRNLTGNGVADICFDVKKGEILGFAGLVGCGRTELMSLIFGDEKKASGEIIIRGSIGYIKNCRDAVNHGIGLIPEDRKNNGLLLEHSIRDNMTLAHLPKISRLGVIDRKQEHEIIEQFSESLKIKAVSSEVLVNTLSGGNQQKVVVAKWLITDCDILIFDEPTRGIDVGAKLEIYKLLNELIGQGKTILMVSSDTEELLGMSDRLIVLSEGRIAGELDRENFDTHVILDMASGDR